MGLTPYTVLRDRRQK